MAAATLDIERDARAKKKNYFYRDITVNTI